MAGLGFELATIGLQIRTCSDTLNSYISARKRLWTMLGYGSLLPFNKHSCSSHLTRDHWPCIAHLSIEDILKSAVIEEKKFKKR